MYWMQLPWILPIAPGGEHQEIPGHQSCRHYHCGNLLELFDLHSYIVLLFLSRALLLLANRLRFFPEFSEAPLHAGDVLELPMRPSFLLNICCCYSCTTL